MSLVAIVTVFFFRGIKSHKFRVINCMWSKVFFLSWETLFIQDVHGLFKVKLTFIEKIISDLNVCLRTLLK